MSSYLIKTIVLAFKAVSGTAPSTPKHWSDNTSEHNTQNSKLTCSDITSPQPSLHLSVFIMSCLISVCMLYIIYFYQIFFP